MADIIDEVLSDKNEERKVFYFKKALPIVGVITLLAIVAMVIHDARVTAREKYNMEMGDTIVKSLENVQTDPKLVTEGIKHVMDNATNHAKDIASLQMLAMNIASNKLDEAVALAQNITNDSDYLPLTQSYAKFMWLNIVLDSKRINDPENQKLATKYFDSFDKDSTAFYGSVNLLQALYYQKRDKEKAMKIIEKLITSKNVSATIQDEARAIMANMNVQ